MTAKEFKKLSLHQRLILLKKDGEFIGSRLSLGHRIHLFACHGHYMEMWILVGLDQLRWVEIQTNQSILNLYVEKIDLRKRMDF